MELIQYIIIPFLIIFPALISFAILVRILSVDRKLLAIVSGFFGGVFYGQLYAGAMHFEGAAIFMMLFGMIGAFQFFGLAELKNKNSFLDLHSRNIGFLIAALFLQYLILYDMRGFAFIFSLNFEKQFWLVWLTNFVGIGLAGLMVRSLFSIKKSIKVNQ